MELISGLDLVEIKRIAELNPAIKDHFIRRILTAKEREISTLDRSVAGVFAAKRSRFKSPWLRNRRDLLAGYGGHTR